MAELTNRIKLDQPLEDRPEPGEAKMVAGA
jgi:hypothetical protein